MENLPRNLSVLDDSELGKARFDRDERMSLLFRSWPSLSKIELLQLTSSSVLDATNFGRAEPRTHHSRTLTRVTVFEIARLRIRHHRRRPRVGSRRWTTIERKATVETGET